MGIPILQLFAIGFAVNLSNLYCQTVHFLEVEYGQKASLEGRVTSQTFSEDMEGTNQKHWKS